MITSKCSMGLASSHDTQYSISKRNANGSIVLLVAQADARSAERPGLRKRAQRLGQRYLELRRGKAARVGDDRDVDVVGDIFARRNRGLAPGRLVGAQDLQPVDPRRRAQLAELV